MRAAGPPAAPSRPPRDATCLPPAPRPTLMRIEPGGPQHEGVPPQVPVLRLAVPAPAPQRPSPVLLHPARLPPRQPAHEPPPVAEAAARRSGRRPCRGAARSLVAGGASAVLAPGAPLATPAHGRAHAGARTGGRPHPAPGARPAERCVTRFLLRVARGWTLEFVPSGTRATQFLGPAASPMLSRGPWRGSGPSGTCAAAKEREAREWKRNDQKRGKRRS